MVSYGWLHFRIRYYWHHWRRRRPHHSTGMPLWGAVIQGQEGPGRLGNHHPGKRKRMEQETSSIFEMQPLLCQSDSEPRLPWGSYHCSVSLTAREAWVCIAVVTIKLGRLTPQAANYPVPCHPEMMLNYFLNIYLKIYYTRMHGMFICLVLIFRVRNAVLYLTFFIQPNPTINFSKYLQNWIVFSFITRHYLRIILPNYSSFLYLVIIT